MPIYEYRCSSCGFQKEYLQKVTEPLLTGCPECGKESFRKMLTAAGFQLKGSGWYATDFKGAPRQTADKAKPANDEASKSESAKSESAKSEPAKSESAKSDAPVSSASGTAARPAAESHG
ncbi:MAG: zinc ribbon domain-containing protein [Betaproteobacteria bacterium]|nr:zinc ribbon domain-containing protein [Betaproteobacteria bacterium]